MMQFWSVPFTHKISRPNSSQLNYRLSESYRRKVFDYTESSIIVTPMKGCWIVGKKVGWVQREAPLTSRGAKVILPFRIYSAFLSFEVDSTEKWPKTQISTKKHLKASTVDTKFKLLFKKLFNSTHFQICGHFQPKQTWRKNSSNKRSTKLYRIYEIQMIEKKKFSTSIIHVSSRKKYQIFEIARFIIKKLFKMVTFRVTVSPTSVTNFDVVGI